MDSQGFSYWSLVGRAPYLVRWMDDLNSPQKKAELLEELAALEACCGDYFFELLPTLEQLALVCHTSGAWQEAATYYLRVIEIREMAQTSDLPEHDLLGLVKAQHSLGLLYRVQESFSQAHTHYTKALAYSSMLYGARHFKTIEMQNYLSGLYFAWCKCELSAALPKNSVGFYQTVHGPENATEAMTLYALALITRDSTPYSASARFKRSTNILHIDLARLTMEDPHDFVMGLMQISRDRFRHGNFAEAEQLFRQSLVLELKEIWPGHPLVADSFQLLGDLYRSFGMTPQAESMYQNAYRLRSAIFGSGHLQVAATAHALAVLLSDLRRYQEAEPYIAQACKIRASGGFPPVLASSLKVQGAILRHLNRLDESEEAMTKAQEILTRYGSAHELI